MDRALTVTISRRSLTLYGVIILLGAIIVGRLFYLQVLRHDYYADAAIAEHEAKFTIPANRGQIFALDGDVKVPLVLNEVLPTVYVDPQGIDDEDNIELATQLSEILDIERGEILEKLWQNDSRYQVIKRRTPHAQIERLEAADLDGVGIGDETYRVYPQNGLAGQTIGFVNSEGEGQYGIEQFLNEKLSGQDGRLNAVTDVYGIPLSSNEDNVSIAPVDGQDVTLTIDINIQKYVEEALARGVKAAKSESGSAIVVDPNTGAIKAMANYPSYSPEKFGDVEDYSVYTNDVVSTPYETGSGVKVFTMSAGLNEGAITPDEEYYDPGYVQVEDRRIENAGLSGGKNRTMTEVITNSVNTGVVYALAKLGGGEINEQARETLYDYFTNRFGFGSATGVEQANEASGLIYSPDSVEGNNVRYANMAFGQGMTVTMLQMVAGLSALVNGGDYYQPYLVHASDITHDPRVIRTDIISDETSTQIKSMMETVVQSGGGYVARRDGYVIGGKTGTAQVLNPETGEYDEFREIGSFLGFGGNNSGPQYVIMTRVDEPQISGYAGTAAAAPIFADISNWLIDYYQIPPN